MDTFGHTYALSKASKTYIKMVEDLLRQYRCQYIFYDLISSNELKKKLKKKEYGFGHHQEKI